MHQQHLLSILKVHGDDVVIHLANKLILDRWAIKLGKEKLPSSHRRHGDKSPSGINRFQPATTSTNRTTVNSVRDNNEIISSLIKKANRTPTVDTAKLVSLSSKIQDEEYTYDTAGIASKILHFEAQLSSSDTE
jgi:anti-sigma28 factor (negative regulator of flagellin synthesis)